MKKFVIDPMLRRWPRAQSGFFEAKFLMRRHVFRSREVWVQVQSGFAEGMWMLLRIPGEGAYWRGEHEPELQSALEKMVRPGDVVYDIGAHLGAIALGTARLVGTAGRVVAFDGDPENVLRLQGNSLRNHLGARLQVVHAAVWSHTARNGISFRRGTTWSHGGVEADGQCPVRADGALVSVPVITLDDFIAAGSAAPQLIKIDVEGGEYEVLRGGSDLFARQRPVILAEVHHQQAAEQILAWLKEFQYSAEWKIPAENFPRSLTAWPTERDQPLLSR